MTWRTIFGSTKNHSVKGSLKNISSLPFIIWRTFFNHKEPLVKQKYVKGSLWNYLDKNGSSEAWSTFIFNKVCNIVTFENP